MALLLVIALTLASCGLKLGEENKTKDTVDVQSIACIDSTITKLKLYFAGTATDDQVASSLQCLQDVFISFKENIRGDNKDAFTAKEIALFVEKNFIQDGTTFSDSFLDELMNLKVAVIGGSNKLFLKSEIDSLVNLLAVIKPDLVRLNKSMRIISFKWTSEFQPINGEFKEQQFQQAKSDFNKLIQKLSGEFAKVGNTYQIDSLLNFTKEILKLGKSETSTIDAIEKARPFIKKFKVLLIGGDVSLANSEWSRLGSTLHEGLFQLLRYQYFLKDVKDTDTDVKWNGYEKIAIDLSGLVENLLDAKETQTLTNYELFEISQSLDKIYPDIMLSLPLIESIGHIKVMLLGDSPSGRIGWSKSDFAKLRNKIPKLFSEFSILVKTYEYLHNNKDPQSVWHTSQNEFESIETNTVAAVQELSELVERPYNLYYLKVLIQELSKGLFKDTLILPDNFESLFNVVLSAKTIMTGEEDNSINVSNIKLLLKVGAKAYLNFIEYDIFIAPLKTEHPEYFIHFDRVFHKLINTLELNLNLKSTKLFSTKELTHFILNLQSEKVIQTRLTESSLESMFSGFWSHILIKLEDRINGKLLPGFDSAALRQINDEVTIFLKTQNVLSQIFAANLTLTKSKLNSEMLNRLNNTTDLQLKTGLSELSGLIKANIPLNLNQG